MTLKTAVAAPFRHLRKTALKKSEIVYYFALDRKWMSTEQASVLIKNAEEEGLLCQSAGVFTLSFDPNEVTIPLGYRPTSAVFERKDVFTELVTRIARAVKKEDTDIIAEMNHVIREGFDDNLLPEAAIAIVARRHNVPIDDFVSALEKNMRKENR